jgi:beta-glucanase (GH16 family)
MPALITKTGHGQTTADTRVLDAAQPPALSRLARTRQCCGVLLMAGFALATTAQHVAAQTSSGNDFADERKPKTLPMNSAASHPKTAAPRSYEVSHKELLPNGTFQDDANGWDSGKQGNTLVDSDTRRGGRRLQLSGVGNSVYKLPAGSLLPLTSYTLRIKARLLQGNIGFVSVRFREPRANGTFRTYRQPVTSTELTEVVVEFTAPAYTDMAEVALQTFGATMQVESASLKMRSAIENTEPVDSWANSYTPPGYAMVFNDEFSKTPLNRNKWFTRYIYSGETADKLNDENQRYADNANHQIEDGVLHLVARKLPRSRPNGANYESGMIRSDFTLLYGFLETRVKMPSGVGTWAAFWLNSDVGETGRINWPPEIDMFEFVNNGKDDTVNGLHIAASTPKGTQPLWLYTDPAFSRPNQTWRAPFDFDKGWHTVGVDWKPGAFDLYVDGLKVMSREHSWIYVDGVVGAPAHILLNLAIGGAWAGRYGIEDSAFPQSLDIDWVRAYKKTN